MSDISASSLGQIWSIGWLLFLSQQSYFSPRYSLGELRPETQYAILPLYMLLLFLHGLWMLLEKERPRRLNPAPIYLMPFLAFATFGFYFISPVPWRAAHELTYLFSAFIFLWVAVNNVRTRAHLWVLLVSGLLPVAQATFIGFYQFFQEPTKMANAKAGYSLDLSAQYLGQATGIFADPNSLATYLLLLLPCVMIAAFVPRFPMVLRIFCFYVGLILVVGITFTQTYWAAAAVVLLMAIVPWFCFKQKKRRVVFGLLGVSSASGVFLFMFFLNPLFRAGLHHALSEEGEGVRLLLWRESFTNLLESPIFGHGAGSYSYELAHSTRLSLAESPLTPHNDYILILEQYGLLGAGLLFGPLLLVLLKSYRRWREESFDVRLKGKRGTIMPPQKFFLSIAMCGVCAILVAAFFSFVLYVPALLLAGTLLISVLIKSSYNRTVRLPDFPRFGGAYFTIAVLAGLTFWMTTSLSVEAHGLELRASQRLDQLAERRVALSGETTLLRQVIRKYEDAVIVEPGNVDAWLGLSAAVCQLHYSAPSRFRETGSRAVYAASRAYEICPDYWLVSVQMGVALALLGDEENARDSLLRGVALAPNSSNAHYYLAAFLSNFPDERQLAVDHVLTALEIDPKNQAAKRLQRKLLIL